MVVCATSTLMPGVRFRVRDLGLGVGGVCSHVTALATVDCLGENQKTRLIARSRALLAKERSFKGLGLGGWGLGLGVRGSGVRVQGLEGVF